MRSVMIVAPAVEPVSLDEAKSHCVIEHDNDDVLLAGMILAGRRWVEQFVRRQLITATWKKVVHSFPSGPIRLPYPPLQSVSSITYLDDSGESTVLSSSLYQVDAVSVPGLVVPAPGETWPGTEAGRLNAVEIEYLAGYGDHSSHVPEELRLAILQLVGHWYENRETVVVGVMPKVLEFTVTNLCYPYRFLGPTE